jgi:hypothetical protein
MSFKEAKEAKYDNIPANIVDDYPRVSGARVCEVDECAAVLHRRRAAP